MPITYPEGGRHDRIQMLALLIQNSELGNIRSIHDAGSMALALGKDLGYGTPPAYGMSFERYYAEKIAAETGREVPIIKSSAIIKPPLKQVDPEAIASKFLEGYNSFSLKAVSEQKDEGVASELTVQFEGLSREDALRIAPQVRAIAAARAKEMEEQEIKARPPAPEVPKVDFWGMVKDQKITDVQVEFAPGDPGRGYRNIFLYTYAILENGKRVRMNEEMFKGTDVAKAQKLGLEQFRQRKLWMTGETVGKNVRESTFIDLNSYEDYVKQAPVPVQKRFEEPGAITGGATARQILRVTEPEDYYFGTQVEVLQGADPELEPYFTGTVKRLLNNGELVEVHPEGDPREVSVRVPVDRVNIIRLVQQREPKKIKTLYRYYYSHRPPGIGTQPEGYINYESWMPATTTPHGRTAFGWVEYDRPLTNEEITGYELFEDEVELPKLVKELVQFARDEGIEEAMKVADDEYGRAVWDWLKSRKRIRAGAGQKEQIRDEIMRLAGITAAPPAEQPSPGVQARFNAYIRSTVLQTGALASPKFLSDERMAQDIERNIQVSKDEARALVPQFRAIAEKIINKEEVESVKETFGIDVEQEAHKLGIDLADYAITKAESRVFLQHKTIVQRRYEIKSPAGFMKKQEEETQERLREAQRRKALTVPPAAPPAAKQSLEEQIREYGKWIREHTTGEAGVKRLTTSSYETVISNLKQFIRQYYNLSPTEDYFFERTAHRQVEISIGHLANTFFNVAANGWDLADTFKEWRPTQTRAEFEMQKQELEKPQVAPATPPVAKPAQSIQEIKQQVISSIQAARTVEELQPILKGIGFLPLPEPEKRQVMDLYQNKYSMLMSERPFGVPVKTEEKPKVIGAPTRQQIVEAEGRRRAEGASRLRGQIPLVGGAATAARLEKFEPGAMEKARAEAEARKRIEQLGLPYGIHPVIKRLAESQQEVLKFGNKRAKDTVEDIVLRKYVQYCPPGTIIDNRTVPKVTEKWWVYPPKLRTCITQVEQKLAGEGMVKENTQPASMRNYIRGAQGVREPARYARTAVGL